MRKLLVSSAFLLLALAVAGQASANVLLWSGTATTKLGAGKPSQITIHGLATINNAPPILGSPLPQHINWLTIHITSGLPGGNAVPVTDPEVSGIIKTIATTIQPNSRNGGPGLSSVPYQFGPLSGGGPLTQNIMPVPGTARVCLILSGCPNFLPLFLTKNSGNTGVGVGGLITVGGAGAIRISLQNNPWTIGTGMAVRLTDNSAFSTVTDSGFLHGPGSTTSTTGDISGIVQLITPVQVATIGIPGQTASISLFGTLRIHFVPEPGLLLLLGSGVVGLALLGRSRMKK